MLQASAAHYNRIMRALKQQFKKQLKRLQYAVFPRHTPNSFRHNNVPYFAQWESKELVNDIISKKIKAEDDPKWRSSGAKTKQEYALWSRNGCGMACTKMMLAHRNGVVKPLVELGKQCATFGGYRFPLDSSPGLYYKPYVTFLEKAWGISATVKSGLILPEIMHELAQGNYIIASVNAQIRDPRSTPKHRGGHLVLLLGYDKTKQELYLHNPSGNTPSSQTYAAISFADFQKFFSERGIIISGKRNQ